MHGFHRIYNKKKPIFSYEKACKIVVEVYFYELLRTLFISCEHVTIFTISNDFWFACFPYDTRIRLSQVVESIVQSFDFPHFMLSLRQRFTYVMIYPWLYSYINKSEKNMTFHVM